MNIFKRVGKAIYNIVRLIVGEPAVKGVADAAKKQAATLKKNKIKNNALKNFELKKKIFKQKHGKSVYAKNMTLAEREEAEDIFQSFLNNKTSTLEGIEEEYDLIEDLPGIRKGVEDIAEMAHQVDIAKNRERAAFINDILGSPVVKSSWNTFISEKEKKANVKYMEQAINEVANELYEDDTYNLFNAKTRQDKILDKYRELTGKR